MIGRTHGIHAEPTTFGAKVALWALAARARPCPARGGEGVRRRLQAVRRRRHLLQRRPRRRASRRRAARAASGAGDAGRSPGTATPSCCAPWRRSRRRANSSPSSSATSSAPRWRRCIEGFKPGQKGSSAMPHKRNPISAETISGLARVVRSNLLAGLQDIALWHERDISHSSVERIVLPDSSTARALHDDCAWIDCCRGCRSTPSGCVRTSGRATGWCSANPCCWRWSPPARQRDDAYRIVQRNAMTAWREGTDFRGLLEADPDVTLDKAALDEAFDLERSLRHLDRVGAHSLDELRPTAADAGALQRGRRHTDLPPRGVGDALAGAVAGGDLRRSRPRPTRGRRPVSIVSSSLVQIAPLLDQQELGERIGCRQLIVDARRCAS